MQDTVARLPTDLREALKEPLGPIVTDIDALLEGVDGPIIAVGDIVTYHLQTAGVNPSVAIIDGRTERSAIDQSIRNRLPLEDGRHIPNEAATLSAELIEALTDAIDSTRKTVLVVDGEEDLAALPAVVAAPDGALVVYGQPGEGMVRVIVDAETRERARSLLQQFEDSDRLWTLLGDG